MSQSKKSAVAKKLHQLKKSPRLKGANIEKALEAMEEEGLEGLIEQILFLYVKGCLRTDIVAAGYNKTTVYRQTGEYDKLKKGPVKEFHGYAMYEARIERIMKSKGCSRDKAIDFITTQDLSSK